MTVNKLRQLLASLPQDAPVVQYAYGRLHEITTAEVLYTLTPTGEPYPIHVRFICKPSTMETQKEGINHNG